MKQYKPLSYLLLLIVFSQPAQSQITDETIAGKYPFIHNILNRITYTSNLNTAYEKLYQLQTIHTGKLTIVHIGDSHVQAGSFTEVIRNNLQTTFGNAGRGLIFPYQVANTNAPLDVKSFSNVKWKVNRVIRPDIPLMTGVAGYVIQTTALTPVISFSFDGDNDAFNRLRFYFDSSNVSWVMHTNASNVSTIIRYNGAPTTIKLNHYINNFTIAGLPSSSLKNFYGVSLEKDSTGVLYHSIGVNGATYDAYNTSPLFWQQLSTLHADIFIVSMATNEAQRTNFSSAAFIASVDTFIKNLKHISPAAAIIITTPPDSYKNGKPNILVQSFSNDLMKYCSDNKISFWNLYNISNGSGSVAQWNKYGLLQADGVHYTADGYHIQGSLFYNAFIKGYADYKTMHKNK